MTSSDIAGPRDIPAPRVPRASPPACPGVVAVVSDGSAPRPGQRAVAAKSIAALLSDDAAALRALTGLPVHAVPMRVLPAPADSAPEFGAHLGALAPDIGAIFLTHTDPARVDAVQQVLREAGGPPLVTDNDTTAISLTSALLTALTRLGATPAASRVVIAGSADLPALCPLLMAVGIGDICSWNAGDAPTFPLHRIARHATVLIDLLDATRSGPASEHLWPTVLAPHDPAYRLLPAPGMLRALANHPRPPVDIDIGIRWACALTLAAVTPRDQLLPPAGDPRITDLVTFAVLGALHHKNR